MYSINEQSRAYLPHLLVDPSNTADTTHSGLSSLHTSIETPIDGTPLSASPQPPEDEHEVTLHSPRVCRRTPRQSPTGGDSDGGASPSAPRVHPHLASPSMHSPPAVSRGGGVTLLHSPVGTSLYKPPVAVEAHISALESQLSALTAENRHLRQTAAIAAEEERALVAKHESDIAALQSSLDQSVPLKKHQDLLREQSVRANRAAYDAEERASDLQRQLAALEEQHASHVLETQKTSLRCESLEHDLTLASEELEVARVRFEDAQRTEAAHAKLRTKYAAVQNVRAQHIALEEAHAALEAEVVELRSARDEYVHILAPQHEKCKELLLTTQADLREARNLRQAAELAVEEMRTQVDTAREQATQAARTAHLQTPAGPSRPSSTGSVRPSPETKEKAEVGIELDFSSEDDTSDESESESLSSQLSPPPPSAAKSPVSASARPYQFADSSTDTAAATNGVSAAVQARLRVLISENEDLKLRAHDAAATADHLTAQLADLRTQLTSSQRASNAADELERKLAALQESHTDLNDQLDEMRQELHQCSEERDTAERAAEEQAALAEELQEQLDEARANGSHDDDDGGSHLARLQAENATLLSSLEEWKARHRDDLLSMNMKLLTLEQERERLQGGITPSRPSTPTQLTAVVEEDPDVDTTSTLSPPPPPNHPGSPPPQPQYPPSLAGGGVDAAKIASLKARLTTQSRELLTLKQSLSAATDSIHKLESDRDEVVKRHQRELCKALDALSALQGTQVTTAALVSPKSPHQQAALDAAVALSVNTLSATQRLESAESQLAASESKLRTLYAHYQRLLEKHKITEAKLRQIVRGPVTAPIHDDAVRCREEIIEREKLRVQEREVSSSHECMGECADADATHAHALPVHPCSPVCQTLAREVSLLSSAFYAIGAERQMQRGDLATRDAAAGGGRRA